MWVAGRLQNDFTNKFCFQEGVSPSAAVVREGECVIVTLKGLMCITQRCFVNSMSSRVILYLNQN